MPKFIITECVPATLVWTYEVEAEDEEKALDQVYNGDIYPSSSITKDISYGKATYDIEKINEQ